MDQAQKTTITTSAGGSWRTRVLRQQRRRLFDAFLLFRQGAPEDTVLDVGLQEGPPGLQDWGDFPAKSLVTTFALRAEGAVRLPYESASFDWVYCGEVLEQLADPIQQQILIAECYRVARKGVFVTTPNRLHPLEFNTGLPFLHWLPAPLWQRVLRLLGCTRRAPVNLLDGASLYALAAALPGAPAHDVGHKRVLGLKAHFFLMINRGA